MLEYNTLKELNMTSLSKMDSTCLSDFPAEVLIYILTFFDVESI